jgi:hypothetical protein
MTIVLICYCCCYTWIWMFVSMVPGYQLRGGPVWRHVDWRSPTEETEVPTEEPLRVRVRCRVRQPRASRSLLDSCRTYLLGQGHGEVCRTILDRDSLKMRIEMWRTFHTSWQTQILRQDAYILQTNLKYLETKVANQTKFTKNWNSLSLSQ